MATADDLVALKALAEKAEREKARAGGALEQLMGRLNKEFRCKTLGEAQAELGRLKLAERDAETAFAKALARFKRDYKEEL